MRIRPFPQRAVAPYRSPAPLVRHMEQAPQAGESALPHSSRQRRRCATALLRSLAFASNPRRLNRVRQDSVIAGDLQPVIGARKCA